MPMDQTDGHGNSMYILMVASRPSHGHLMGILKIPYFLFHQSYKINIRNLIKKTIFYRLFYLYNLPLFKIIKKRKVIIKKEKFSYRDKFKK